ncbi:BppU family phage baseplate upper protein [Listeria valentina]|uniref:BppU family phage baseplate upper protein n=1 Tax=Listeria valentina TaxID=2705293 RepID=UPI001430D134|nr:BppU family phage baseplate upper protein [Listeria valentina]
MNELNSVYKKVQSELDVSVYGVQPINLKATFSTQDENTAFLRFVVKKDGTLLPLSEPAKAVIYLVGNQLKVKKDMEVDREKSTVSYLLTPDEVKHYGKVDGEVYIHYNNEGKQSLSVHKFSFHIDQALIDQDLDIIENVYISDLEDIKSEYLDQFENLKSELEEKVTQLQTDTAELQKEAQELEQKFNSINPEQFAKKTGDTFTGSVNLDAQEALNVRYGYLFHYVGAKPNGTVITMDFAEEFGVWSKRLEMTVGGEGVQSEDGEFGLEPITSLNTYVRGWAPASYTSSQSTIDGVKKPAKGTITPTSAISVKRDGVTASIKVNNGYTLTDEVYAVPDLNTALDFGKDYYVNASAQNAPVVLKTDTQGSLYSIRRSASSVIQMYMHYAGRVFTRYFLNNAPYIHSKTDANGWSELASISDAQAKADKALTDAKAYFDSALTVQKVTLTPKNGFTASRTLTASYIKVGNRYLVMIGGIVAKGTGTGTGICATVPAMLAPDTDWNKLFSGAQQSTAASNHANIYLSSGGDINIVAVGAADVNTGLDGISYFTKEVTA